MDTPDTGTKSEQQQEQAWMDLHEPRFFIAGGTLAPDAASYLRRAADDELFETLMEGQYAYMLDSRQKGKSSLVARTQIRLESAGVKTIKIDLQSIGSNLNVEQWYASLVRLFGRQLGLEREAFECWGENHQIGPFGRWLSVIEQVVLPKTSMPLVVFVDEVDFVRSLPFSADEFFAGIRECYNRRARDESFTRLTFCLIGSATPSQLVHNVAITPFNIGREVKLTDFARSELSPFAPALRNGEALLDRVFFWTKGHPYLTQAIGALIVEDSVISASSHVDRLVERTYLSTEARQREPNLLDVSRRLLETQAGNLSDEECRGQMLNAYSQILSGKKLLVDDSEWRLAALRLSGAVKENSGTMSVRNEIYRRVFNKNWIRANMPGAELRRQKAAARIAMLRTGSFSLLIIAAISTLALYSATMAAARRDALLIASENLRTSNRSSYQGRMMAIDRAAMTGEYIRIAELLELTKNSSNRGWEWGYWNARSNSSSFILHANSKLNGLQFTRDGRTLVAVAMDGLYQWDVNSRALLSHRNSTLSPLSFLSADAANMIAPHSITAVKSGRSSLTTFGSQMWACNAPDLYAGHNFPETPLTLVSLRKGPICTLDTLGKQPMGPLVRLNPTSIAYSNIAGDLLVAEIPSGRIIRTIKFPEVMAGDFVLDPRNEQILFVTNHVSPFIYDQQSNKLTIGFVGHKSKLTGIALSPDGTTIATTSNDGTCRLWDVDSQKELAVFSGHRDNVSDCQFSPDGRLLATSSMDQTVRLWDLQAPRFPQIIEGQAGEISSVTFSKDGKWLLSQNSQGSVWIWRYDVSRVVFRANQPVRRVSFVPHQDAILAAELNGTLRLIDIESGDSVWIEKLRTAPVSAISLSDNGEFLAVGHTDGYLEVRQVSDARTVWKNRLHSGTIKHIIFSPNGELVATVSKDRTARVWDCKIGAQIWHSSVQAFEPYSCSFSRDSEKVAVAWYDGVGRITEVKTGKTILTDSARQGRMWKVAFSDDGRQLLTCSSDGTSRLWDATSGRERWKFRHGDWVGSARFSRDESRIVTSSADGTVRIWDRASGTELLAIRDHKGVVWNAEFSPDGQDLVTCGADGTIRIYRVSP